MKRFRELSRPITAAEGKKKKCAYEPLPVQKDRWSVAICRHSETALLSIQNFYYWTPIHMQMRNACHDALPCNLPGSVASSHVTRTSFAKGDNFANSSGKKKHKTKQNK